MTATDSPPPRYRDAVALNIRQEMLSLNVGVAELADRLHVHRTWVSARINAKRVIDVDEVQSIAAALGCPISALTGTREVQP